MIERPARLGFLVGGAQKGGTTALATYLAHHPMIRLPACKEGHVFDDPAFPDGAAPEEVDRVFSRIWHAANFGEAEEARDAIWGDATPITIFDPLFVDRVHHYNPRIRWVLLLREPVSRAISHWQMERRRGTEPFGLLRAALAEHGRMDKAKGQWHWESALRWASYAARSDYAPQIRHLLARFAPEQLLLLASDELALNPSACVDRVALHLGLPPIGLDNADLPRVFEGGDPAPSRFSPGRLFLRWRLRDACRRWPRATSLEAWET